MPAFQPQAPALAFSADSSAPTSVLVTWASNLSNGVVMVSNTHATVGVTIGWGASDAIAKLNAVIGGSPNQFWLNPASQVMLSINGQYMTGISASAVGVKVQAGTGDYK